MKRALSVATLTLAIVVLPAAAAWAHPLGNFTINHYAGIEMAPGHAKIVYALDVAEIPTF